MGRRSEFYTQVGDGPAACQVGYSSKLRGGFLAVVFVGPQGGRLEKMTPCKRKDANYHIEAAKVIARAYAPSYPDPKRTGWDDGLAEVERTAADLRPATLVAYRKVVRVLRATLNPAPHSPNELTPELATRFGRLFLGGTYTRGKATDAPQYKRSAATLASHVRNLSALWHHFVDLAIVKENPWRTVRRPQVEKKRKPVPAEAQVEHFFGWVHDRYPDWQRLHAVLELKALSGCRTLDIVQLRSNQLRDGRVVWTADQTKHKEGRAVLVPAELFGTLKALAGPVFLWEGFIDDLKRYRPSRNRLPETFDPKTVYWVLGNLFREYSDAHPDRPRLTPHALRRRAITLTTLSTQSVDATASAIGINPATARGYYLDAQRAFDTDEIFRRTAGLLIPKTAPTIPPLSGNSGDQPGTDGNKSGCKSA